MPTPAAGGIFIDTNAWLTPLLTDKLGASARWGTSST
jgi:hypothetical protein